MPRPPRPEDLYRLRVPTEPRLSPTGSVVAFTLQTVAPRFDGYRHAVWLASVDGTTPARQITLGAGHDRHPRFSPDGRYLAFISDRRSRLEEEPERGDSDREDQSQVYLLPLEGGEARRLTDMPRGVDGFEWSPDGSRLVVISASVGATWADDLRARGKMSRAAAASRIGEPPASDYRFVDRLAYMHNDRGFIFDRVPHLWLVDVSSGEASRLTNGRVADSEPAWSPDGTRIAFVSNRRPNADLAGRSDIHVVDVGTGVVTPITRGPKSVFSAPAWMPDGTLIAAMGHRLERRAGSRRDIWLLAADGSDASPTGGRNLSARHDLMPRSDAASDVTIGEDPPLITPGDGAWIVFSAPIDGAYELWRIAVADGRLQRLTTGRHYISGWDAVPAGRGRGGFRVVYLRSTATETPDVWVLDVPGGARSRAPSGPARRLTTLNESVFGELDLVEPIERRWSVDGREIQGWYMAAGKGARPLVVQIHGGPHTLYAWSLVWEFQIVAASGMSVMYCNPRGSEGYGEAFNDANHRDWGDGPMRDILAGVDGLVADGLADPDRLGVTGGSYGGYLTNWIVGHDQRFRAAMTCRCVSDMTTLFLTGDISGTDWARMTFEAMPWEDPAYYREISPITYADQIYTPLLIQHSEKDLRTTIAQAEALFTVLRALRRPVRLLRVPEETHELTRSGTPFRRVENLRIVESWFRHFLVDGKRGLPPLPKVRGGR